MRREIDVMLVEDNSAPSTYNAVITTILYNIFIVFAKNNFCPYPYTTIWARANSLHIKHLTLVEYADVEYSTLKRRYIEANKSF